MRKSIILFIAFYTSIVNAQINIMREYEYVGNETNNSGLRIVGVKTEWDQEYRTEEEYGCIDKDGNEIVPLKYRKITLGKEIPYILAEAHYQQTLYSEDGKQCYIKNNKILVTPKSFRKYKCVIVGKKYHTKLGVMNCYSEMKVPAIYDDLFWIDENKGYLAARWNDKWSIIDYKGNEIRKLNYKNVGECINGILLVENFDEKWWWFSSV